MLVYFADGPLNGQTRDIEVFTPRYRVPILTTIQDWGPGYWEGTEQLSQVGDPLWPVGYYESSNAFLKTGARIFIFGGIE